MPSIRGGETGVYRIFKISTDYASRRRAGELYWRRPDVELS